MLSRENGTDRPPSTGALNGLQDLNGKHVLKWAVKNKDDLTIE